METDIIWIYSDTTTESDIIDYGNPAALPGAAIIEGFLKQRGYTAAVEKAESNRIAVRPPLTAEHLREFGQFCVQDRILKQYGYPPTASGSKGIAVIDRRHLQNGLGTQVVRY